MRIFGWEIRRHQHAGLKDREITDADREASLEARRANAQRKKLEHEIELLELRIDKAKLLNELGETEPEQDDVEEMFKSIILPLLGGVPSAQQTPQPSTISVTDDAAAEEMVKLVPEKYRVVARRMSDDQIRAFLKKKTEYDDETITTMIRVFREKNL